MLKRRLHLFEFCDQKWFSGVFREAFMDCLDIYHRLSDFVGPMAPEFAKWAKARGADAILDLGSGGGEHIQSLLHGAANSNIKLPKIVLSDLYPQLIKYEMLRACVGADQLDFEEQSLSAISSINKPYRLRCIFSAFHHFRPEEAQKIINCALHEGDGLFIGETLMRTWKHLFFCFIGIIPALCAPLFSKKFSLKKLLIGTLIPIVPLIVLFDGFVSVLRSYTVDEIRELVPVDQRDSVFIESGTVATFFGLMDASFVLISKKG